MHYLIDDTQEAPPYLVNHYILSDDPACYNSGWGPLDKILKKGVSHHADEDQTETTLEGLQTFSTGRILVESEEPITKEYLMTHYPELLV